MLLWGYVSLIVTIRTSSWYYWQVFETLQFYTNRFWHLISVSFLIITLFLIKATLFFVSIGCFDLYKVLCQDCSSVNDPFNEDTIIKSGPCKVTHINYMIKEDILVFRIPSENECLVAQKDHFWYDSTILQQKMDRWEKITVYL